MCLSVHLIPQSVRGLKAHLTLQRTDLLKQTQLWFWQGWWIGGAVLTSTCTSQKHLTSYHMTLQLKKFELCKINVAHNKQIIIGWWISKKGIVNEGSSIEGISSKSSMGIFSSLIKFSGFINGSEVRKSVAVKFAEDTVLIRINSGKVGPVWQMNLVHLGIGSFLTCTNVNVDKCNVLCLGKSKEATTQSGYLLPGKWWP